MGLGAFFKREKGNLNMEQKKLDRISELFRKSKTPEGLTPEEKEEQTALRNEYRRSVVANLAAQLDNTVIVEPDGTKIPVKDRKKD